MPVRRISLKREFPVSEWKILSAHPSKQENYWQNLTFVVWNLKDMGSGVQHAHEKFKWERLIVDKLHKRKLCW